MSSYEARIGNPYMQCETACHLSEHSSTWVTWSIEVRTQPVSQPRALHLITGHRLHSRFQFSHKLKSDWARVWLVINNNLIPIGYGSSSCAFWVASAFMLARSNRSSMYWWRWDNSRGVLLDRILAEKAQDQFLFLLQGLHFSRLVFLACFRVSMHV